MLRFFVILCFTFYSKGLPLESNFNYNFLNQFASKSKDSIEGYPYNLRISSFLQNKVEPNSNVILIKYYEKNFNQTLNNQHKYIPNIKFKLKSVYIPHEQQFMWYDVMPKNKSSLNKTIFCSLSAYNGTSQFCSYAIEIIENKAQNLSQIAIPIYINEIKKLSCNESKKDILVESYIDNDGNVKTGLPKYFELFKNQIRYAFNVTSLNKDTQYIYSCAIYKLFSDAPIIDVKDCEESVNFYEIGKICVIKKTFVSQSFKPSLKHIGGLNKFYSNEKLFYSIASFKRENKLYYNNQPKEMIEEIDVKNFIIFNIIYNCDFCGKDGKSQITNKIVFFGPENPNEILYSETHIYNNGTLKMKPNCTIKKYQFAYLDKVSFEDMVVHINTLTISYNNLTNAFQLNDKFVAYSKEDNPKGKLICYFKTPTYYILEEYIFRPIFLELFDLITEQETAILNVLYQDSFEKNKIKFISDEMSLLENQKRSISEIIYSIQSFNTISIFLFIGLVTIIIFLISVFMYNIRKNIIIIIYRIRAHRIHRNIYIWWKRMLSQNWSAYCNLIHSELYIPEKILASNGKTFIYEGEEIECNTDELFCESLVDSQKFSDQKISAHYIFARYNDKKYILSDHPTPQLVQQFWDMLLNENVSVTIAFLYNYPENQNPTSWKYWPNFNVNYGHIELKKEKTLEVNLKNISVYTYNVKNNNNGKTRKINVFHVERWKEHTPPESTLTLINLYKVVNEISEGQRILVTSRHGAGSTMFIFIYFACIIENMTLDKSIVDPLEIIKNIRGSRYGGAIGTHEFAYIITAITDYFYASKILIDKPRYSLFTIKASNYTSRIFSLIANINSEIKAFFYFSIILDQGIVNQMYVELKKAGNIDKTSLKDLCKNWYKVENDPLLKSKNRYHDIPCFDANSAFNKINDLQSENILKYINANELVYEIKEGLQRKLIMCQAPTRNTVNEVVEMMFEKNVGTLVLLAEQRNYPNTWSECFPINSEKCSFGEYTVVKVTDYGTSQAGTQTVDFYIEKDSKKVQFKLLHYKDWPEKDNPIHAWEFLSLYRATIDSAQRRPIVIQCPNGVGWTGTFALIIYMIDNIGKNCCYDPIKDLSFLRQFRNGAIQTQEQLMIAYIVLREHYRSYITDSQFKIYKWYKLFYKQFFFDPNRNHQLIWSQFMVNSAYKAGFDYEFEDED